MESSDRPGPPTPPSITWAYGLAGLLPFAAGGVGSWITGGVLRSLVQLGLLVYGGLILSFLGGGRWGLEIGRGEARAGVITGSMAGAVVSTLLVAAAPVPVGPRLLVMALAHLGQWAWDVSSTETPAWYPRLRQVLALGAITALLVGAAASLRP